LAKATNKKGTGGFNIDPKVAVTAVIEATVFVIALAWRI